MLRLGSWVLLVMLTTMMGCSSGPEMGQVKGKVTIDGKPLAKGTITFEMKGQRPATARIENGEIVEATTYKLGDGVPVGSHKVAISATDLGQSAVVANPGDAPKGSPPADYMGGGKSLIPTRYNDPAQSMLTAQITAGENTLKFELSSK